VEEEEDQKETVDWLKVNSDDSRRILRWVRVDHQYLSEDNMDKDQVLNKTCII
jgi:hypothetical protein